LRFEKSALARRCIDIYDMTQAVEDGATRPVYCESRVIKLHLDKDTLALIDATYDALEQQSDTATIEKSKKMLGQMESVLGADSTVQSLCEDIVTHYEKYRANLLTGKAMIVAYSRPIAMKIYRKLLELRPAWKEKISVVMTSGNNDPEDWKAIIGTKSHKEELVRKLKDNDDPMKIAIVVDMWLTGFDVPSLATMYIYKPMHGYNLMQAIARVNRVFKDKEGGLIVDYVGIASALKAAMKEYTKRDQSRYGDMDISKVAYPKFQEKLQVCKDLLHGFDFSSFIDGSPLVMAKLVTGGVNFVLDAKAPKRKDLFLREAMLLKQSHSLCSSMTTEQERHEAAYMEAVRSTVVKITYGGSGGKTLSLKEINTQINELLKASIQSQGVISLFDSKQADENISLFDPAVLDEISKMKEKNIAVEILKKLMAEQVSLYKRTNVVQSQKFSEKIAQLMNSYYNGLITNEEVIKELLKTAQEITELYNNGKKLGLTQEELAFYDALTKPENIKDFYRNNELIDLTRELTEMLRKNRTIDWQKKETARASMRKMVKHLLKKYKYPPEDYDTAISTVISQCEMWTDNMTA
jgi:type I restriction enzyme R subunit